MADEARLIYNHCLNYYLSENNKKWKPIGLTFVEYPEGDILGKILAWFSLAPIFILAGFIAVIIFRRELHTVGGYTRPLLGSKTYMARMAFFIGCCLNEGVSLTIKSIIKEPRPNCGGPSSHYTEHGMPSSHAAFIAFFTTFSLLLVYVRLPFQSTDFLDNIWRHLTALGLLCLTAAVSFSRIYLRYHSYRQVFWGLVLGMCIGIFWFLITHHLLTQLFPIITSWKVSEYFMIRDSTRIPSILWFEYTRAREEVRKRQRRKSS